MSLKISVSENGAPNRAGKDPGKEDAVLSAVYRFVPYTDRSFWSATLSAFFAVIACPIASVGLSIYLSNFAGRSLTYGSLGTAVGLLVYLYISAWVVLMGVEINKAIYRRYRGQT